MGIHATAIVDKAAEIDAGVEIGPWSIVGPHVKLKSGARLLSHVAIAGDTTIGERTVIHPFASIGGPPQHAGYKGEPTRVVIGADCVIREYATVNLGTEKGGGVTTVGDKCFLMTAAHVAHDCHVAPNVTFANNATLGGHVVVEEFVFLGGLSAIHQFCRIGAYAFIGGCAAVAEDVIPYGMAVGNHARLAGLNLVGMKRRGLPRPTIHALRAAYAALFEGEGVFEDRLAEVERAHGTIDEIRRVIAFIRKGDQRNLMAAR
jgi:UDP-N-acetylglucosamine acyltransferase